jgi:Domain of unknown function (DUF4349)/Putative zinc-finger
MSANTHLAAPEEVMALLDGELSADRARFISAHIEECSNCRELADLLRGNSHALSKWTVHPAFPSSFESSLVEAAHEISSKRPPAGAAPVRRFLRRHWLLTAGASALTVGVALTFSTVSHLPMGTVAQSAPGFVPNSSGTPVYLYSGASGKENKNSVSMLDEGQEELQRVSERASLGPMIARTVSLSVVVKDLGFSRTVLDAILARHHGYAASLSVSTPENTARSLEASLRIPAAELNAAVAELKSLGHVQNEAQNGEEVTQQHADLVARLKNSRETEQRLQSILLERTGKVSDVLAVEQEIARVRGEIEQMEVAQKSLEHRVDFAAIHLNLAEEYKARINSPSPAISTRLDNALVAGYRDATEMLVGIVLFFAANGPSLLIWLAFLLPLAWLLRRRWLRANAAASSLIA